MGTFSIWHWLIVLFFSAILQLPILWVLKKAGKSRWQFLIAIVPVIGYIWLWVIAFSDWPGLQKKNHETNS